MFFFKILEFLLWATFFVSAFILIVVILLQESKGGGLGEAFGGVGAETFGVRPGGINKFTFALAGIFILSAVFIHPVGRWAHSVKRLPSKKTTAPLRGGPAGGPAPAPAPAPSPSGGSGSGG